MAEAPASGDQVGVQGVDRRQVDPEARLLDAFDHRLEVAPQSARLVERGKVAECGQRRAREDHHEGREGNGDQHRALPGPGRSSRVGAAEDAISGHGTGTAMTTKRGAVE